MNAICQPPDVRLRWRVQVRRFFLLSIKPEYSEKIFAGQKKFELRKKRLGIRRGDIVFVYTSSPKQALTGAFVALGEVEAPVRDVWRRHRDRLGIEEHAYAKYFEGAETAVAISIGRSIRLPEISLPELRTLRPGFTPPQSYMYCPEPIRHYAEQNMGGPLLQAG
jgi:predicted transcriptional regulator